MVNSQRSNQESWFVRCWPVLVIGAAWLWVFWPMMSGRTVVGFRDSASLYYPLFKWIDVQWAAGEIPLWNPFCNFGIPVVADGTSSVFYPGKLIFVCRFLSYPARYGIYLAIHIPIAAAGVFWFARTLRANRAGATLAALSFSFGGSVLFQVTNVVFLVSAAWLPFALCCVWKMGKTGRIRWAVGAGVACALMILGGDPQMVYHVGLIALATMLSDYWRRRRRDLKTESECRSGSFRWLAGASVRLATMVAVASLLSAIQLLPMMVWTQQSERTDRVSAANLYQALSQPLSGRNGNGTGSVANALWGPPIGVTDHAYQFSLAPWSLAELIWPNISGKPFPMNRRWTSALPGSDRVWGPSLYAGVLVVFLGVSAMRLWGRRCKRVWLTRFMLFFGVASFGWYGAVWLINELQPSLLAGLSLGPQVGGVYWAMNLLLPKYYVFRYPAKLFLIASLALSLLAGVHFRGVNFGFTRTSSLVFVFVCGLGAVVIGCVRNSVLNGGMPADDLFGPFDFTGAKGDIFVSLLHPLLVFLGACCLVFLIQRKPRSRLPAKCVAPFIVLLTVVELVVANRWLVPEVASSVFESETRVHAQIESMNGTHRRDRPLRIYRGRAARWEPEFWATEYSPQRLADIVAWQRETLYPKYHLDEGVVLLGSFSSIWPVAYEDFLSSWEPFDLDPDHIATIADGMIIKLPGQSAELIDLRQYASYRDYGSFSIEVPRCRIAFQFGAWISAISWAGGCCVLAVMWFWGRTRNDG